MTPADGNRLGATVGDGATRFVLWAPNAQRSVELVLDDRRVRLEPDTSDQLWDGGIWGADGIWTTSVEGLGHGDRYAYSIDGSEPRPDPASRWQPDGVHLPSAIVDPTRFAWTDSDWRGRGIDDTVLYELHVGTFTPAGTFDAAIEQLARLAELGITTIELMPVNAFAGERNWGYDGVLPFAVQHSYGGPEALARFVDAAHAHGLATILDVVYNHMGPEGNYLATFGPYFTDSYRTPWGPALNVAGEGSDGVRRFVVENAVHWVRDFHLDGFRFDAVHAIVDPTANPLWAQVCAAVRTAAARDRRDVVLIAESSDNDPRHVDPPERNGFGFDAVWCDDYHHTLRVATTDDRDGYYADYQGTPAELADTIAHRWKFRGQFSVARGRRHGRPVDHVAPHRFVVCSQNHDQVGNRPVGERPDHHVDADRRRALAASVLLAPATPMLFMGEEYGERRPFPFFVDHTDAAILHATNEGRRAEFADADWSGDVPEPGSPATFESAVLDPTIVGRDARSARLLAMYTELLRLRRVHPAIGSTASLRVDVRGDTVLIRRRRDQGTIVVALHLADTPGEVPIDGTLGFSSDDPKWGGRGAVSHAEGVLHLPAWTVALTVDA